MFYNCLAGTDSNCQSGHSVSGACKLICTPTAISLYFPLSIMSSRNNQIHHDYNSSGDRMDQDYNGSVLVNALSAADNFSGAIILITLNSKLGLRPPPSALKI